MDLKKNNKKYHLCLAGDGQHPPGPDRHRTAWSETPQCCPLAADTAAAMLPRALTASTGNEGKGRVLKGFFLIQRFSSCWQETPVSPSRGKPPVIPGAAGLQPHAHPCQPGQAAGTLPYASFFFFFFAKGWSAASPPHSCASY